MNWLLVSLLDQPIAGPHRRSITPMVLCGCTPEVLGMSVHGGQAIVLSRGLGMLPDTTRGC
jgi:hypothetical protein